MLDVSRRNTLSNGEFQQRREAYLRELMKDRETTAAQIKVALAFHVHANSKTCESFVKVETIAKELPTASLNLFRAKILLLGGLFHSSQRLPARPKPKR
jgi:hypothetical protein